METNINKNYKAKHCESRGLRPGSKVRREIHKYQEKENLLRFRAAFESIIKDTLDKKKRYERGGEIRTTKWAEEAL